MAARAATYQHIADILSFETAQQDLERKLSQPEFNWDAIVIEGSKHLMLPALYCRLKAKQLLHVLPEDLNSYLEELSAINRNRNKALIAQIHSISELLKAHQINHVFLKGAALLALGCYDDLSERMVGDIDILVSPPQLQAAFQLLKANGYPKTFGFAYENKGFRHLDRLISEERLAAVELHDALLIPAYRHFIDVEDLLKQKIFCNTIALPNRYYLGLHHILAWEINDFGYFYKSIHFKHFYDSIVLQTHKDNLLLASLLSHKFGAAYLELAKLYFKEFELITSTLKMKALRTAHKNYRDYSFYNQVLKTIKQGYAFVIHRIREVFSNPSYRSHALKKIIIRKM